jgi:ABC-type transporter Mla MlaB component
MSQFLRLESHRPEAGKTPMGSTSRDGVIRLKGLRGWPIPEGYRGFVPCSFPYSSSPIQVSGQCKPTPYRVSMKQSKRKQKSPPATTMTEPQVGEPAAPPVVAQPATPAMATESSFVLGSSCTMREGAAIKIELMKLLSVRQTVLVDVSAVERIDTSAMQLLCAFVRDRRARRLATRWTGQPPVFVEAVDILGLTSALGYQPGQRAA